MASKKLMEDLTVKINHIQYTFMAGTDIDFYDNGNVKEGTLAQDVLSDSNMTKYRAGTLLAFDESGSVKESSLVKMEKRENVIVMTSSGSLELNHSLKLEEMINRQIEKGETYYIVDMINADYISSCGIRVLMTSFRKMRAMDGRFVLCNVKEAVTKILTALDLGSHFDVAEDVNAALRSIEMGKKGLSV